MLSNLPFHRAVKLLPSKRAIHNAAITVLQMYFLLMLMVGFYVWVKVMESGNPIGIFTWSGLLIVCFCMSIGLPDLKTPVQPVTEVGPKARVSIHPNLPTADWANLPRGEYVYIIQDISNTHYFKIGRTNYLLQRLNRFAVTLPIQIHVVHIITCTRSVTTETWLHQQFARKRRRGEWFELNDADVEWIKQRTSPNRHREPS